MVYRDTLNDQFRAAYDVATEEYRAELLLVRKQYTLDLDAAYERLLATLDRRFTPGLISDSVIELHRNAAQASRDELAEDARRRTVFQVNGGAKVMAEQQDWYNGVQYDIDKYWPPLNQRIISQNGSEVADSVDQSSEEIVAHLADPSKQGLKKKGLVVGFVQSGKTANYTAVASKAVDRGYRMVIVLSGIHNNLRTQTQLRLHEDLESDELIWLTQPDADFEKGTQNAAALFDSGALPRIAVVKKNKRRLENLYHWLSRIPSERLESAPILVIDDEADQATPNTEAGRDEVSTINSLLRKIWRTVGAGSYVGYTATPFANVFMDPDEETELFPSDFIVALPRPEAYFGAERVFGKSRPDDAGSPDDGLDVVRVIPDEDADPLRPPGKKESRAGFDLPPAPQTLVDAVQWFLLATAVRRARGDGHKHSSMLVHTTHYSDFHFQMKDRIETVLLEFARRIDEDDFSSFRDLYEHEIDRAADAAADALRPSWHELKPLLGAVMQEVNVVVDNSSPDAERIDYNTYTDDGDLLPQTAIVVGGGTLSRGLTLEGLVVSYFVRTTSMYDTLLQMGRWFGYRVGYEDLPRIWTQRGLIADFQFLALVEEEIRVDIAQMCAMKKTPREIGVKVRNHPGRLQITARNKLVHAKDVRLSFGGRRIQSFIFHERGREVEDNLRTARSFLREITAYRAATECHRKNVAALYEDVPAARIKGLLSAYHLHEGQEGFNVGDMADWIDRHASEIPWNVVVLKGRGYLDTKDGKRHDLGSVSLGPDLSVPSINRAPLQVDSAEGRANIKALMSAPDVHLDLSADLNQEFQRRVKGGRNSGKISDEYLAFRQEHVGGTGLLVVYPISKFSRPVGGADSSSRREMEASDHLIGLGLQFPTPTGSDAVGDGDFVSVRFDWELAADDDDAQGMGEDD